MAIAFSNSWVNTTPATSLSITIAPAANDVLIAAVAADSGIPPDAIMWPGPWVSMGIQGVGGDGQIFSVAMLRKATGSETSVVISSVASLIGMVLAFSGVDNTSPLDTSTRHYSCTDTSVGLPSPYQARQGIEPADDGSMLVNIVGFDSTPTGDVSYAFSDDTALTWTVRRDINSGFINIGAGTAPQTTAGPVLAKCVGTLASSSAGWCAALFALRPAGAAATKATPYIDAIAIGTSEPSSTTVKTPPITTVYGSTLLVGSTSSNLTAVADSYGNTYTKIVDQLGDAAQAMQVWECANDRGGPRHTVTTTYSATGTRGIIFLSLIGAGPKDQNVSARDAASPYTVTSGTLANQPQLALSFFACVSTTSDPAEGSGMTMVTTTSDYDSLNQNPISLAKKRVTATTALTPSWTQTNFGANTAICILTYKDAGLPSPMTIRPGFQGVNAFVQNAGSLDVVVGDVVAGQLVVFAGVRWQTADNPPTAGQLTQQAGTATIDTILLDKSSGGADVDTGFAYAALWSMVVTGSGTLTLRLTGSAAYMSCAAQVFEADGMAGGWDSTRVEATNGTFTATNNTTSLTTGTVASAGAAVIVGVLLVVRNAQNIVTPDAVGAEFGYIADGTSMTMDAVHQISLLPLTDDASWTWTGATTGAGGSVVAYRPKGNKPSAGSIGLTGATPSPVLAGAQWELADGDITAPQSAWVPLTGANFAAMIDEFPSDDADYDWCAVPGTHAFEVTTQNATDPVSSVGHLIRYRLLLDSGTITVSLKQGATVIASWTHTGIAAATTQTYLQTLNATQSDSITDYTDLRLSFSIAN
jgi:hypothetical protein